MECIFCRIVKGEAESSRVFEDEKTLAFMTIRPVNPGELLIIPKEHIDHFSDIPDDLASHIVVVAQMLAKKIQQKLSPKRVGYVVHGFGVPHAHLIVVPLHGPHDIAPVRSIRVVDGEMVISEDNIPVVPRGELDKMADFLRS